MAFVRLILQVKFMQNTTRSRWGALLLMAVWLVSCGQLEVGMEVSGTPAVTPVSAELVTVPTATAAPRLTLTPTVTATPTAVSSPTPTPTTKMTASPTATAAPPVPTNTAVAAFTPTPLPPQVHFFSVTPQTVEPGAVLQLAWEAAGDRAEVCVFQVGYTGYRECRETAVSGNLTWIVNDGLRDNFAVELTVYRGEEQAGQGLRVTVVCPAAEAWWFFTPAPPGCPATEAVTTQAATQFFEHGWMVWLEAGDVIYTFFDDGSYALFYGFQLHGDGNTGDGGVKASAGLVAPVRGFGLIWRGEADGAESGWVRDKLGWGVATKFGFETQFQTDQYERFAGVYLRDSQGQIIYLDPSHGRWTVYEPGN